MTYVRQRGGRWQTVAEFDRGITTVVGYWSSRAEALAQAAELDGVEPADVDVRSY